MVLHGSVIVSVSRQCMWFEFCIIILLNLLDSHCSLFSFFQSLSIGCTVNLQCPTCSSTGKRYIENPIVSIEGVDSSILNYNVVSLPNFKSNDFPTIENTDEYPLFDNWIHPYEHGLLNTTSLEGSGQCDGFPSFRQPFPLTDADSADGTFPAVFGKALDAISGEEVTFVYDPHLKMYENTIENPVRSCFVVL